MKLLPHTAVVDAIAKVLLVPKMWPARLILANIDAIPAAKVVAWRWSDNAPRWNDGPPKFEYTPGMSLPFNRDRGIVLELAYGLPASPETCQDKEMT